jgi:DNA-binding winged helix-turn-helix (wHTH) protein
VTRGGIIVDRIRFTVSAGDRVAELTPKPFRVLALLIERSPDIVPCETLWHVGWPGQQYNKLAYGSLRNVICEAKKHLAQLGLDGHALIKSRRAEGYQFVPPLNDDPRRFGG